MGGHSLSFGSMAARALLQGGCVSPANFVIPAICGASARQAARNPTLLAANAARGNRRGDGAVRIMTNNALTAFMKRELPARVPMGAGLARCERCNSPFGFVAKASFWGRCDA